MTLQAEAEPPRTFAAGWQTRAPVEQTAQAKGTAPRPLPCGDLLAFAVLLDRQGFSPGQIDGRAGRNFSRALAAFRSSRNIATTGAPDCDTWQELGGDAAEPTLTAYTITDEDINGPYAPEIPEDLSRQASLPALEYRTALEKIAERFHASPALLRKLNPGLIIEAGRQLSVPAVQAFDPVTKPAGDPGTKDVTIEVTREESALRAFWPDGTLVFFAPVTTGSRHDPLPPGRWTVEGVSWRPRFHYNPDLFWDAKPGDSKSTIQPGPNSPVGVVWIGLDLNHYGLHGTPEPGEVGRTASHGCVRLTNWDAARLAALVRPGTPVVFR
jgi:lipoprotein-anchoring transpeptidase ErfK/SrfK